MNEQTNIVINMYYVLQSILKQSLTKERKDFMTNKTITIILSLLLVVSIGINIWQYSKNNSLNTSVNNFQDDIITLQETISSCNSDISEKDTEIANLSSTIDELKASLDIAINDISSKDKEIEELKAEKPQQANQNETNNDNNNNQNQQQQPKAETPKENPQPPVVNPPAPSGDGEAQRLPDGGFIDEDGVEVHPGDSMFDGGTTYMGNGDSLFDGYW